MMRIYKWRGYTYQIDDKDLGLYPGAELVEKKKPEEVKPEVKPEKAKKTTPKKKKTPANKARQSQNK